MKRTLVVVLVALLSMPLLANFSMAQEKKMSMEEYRRQLADWQKREADAKSAIAQLDKQIDSLKTEINNVQAQIDAETNEMYSLVGTDKAGVDAYRQSLKSVEDQVDGLAALSPEELLKRRKEIDALEAQLNEAKKNKIYALPEMQDMVARIEGKIAQVRAKVPKAVYDEYTVIKGDYLWRISKKPEIYNDPYQWMRIYTYNREQIKDPDLIYPDWVLKIQREVGPDEYLVQKGDYLRKIAGMAEVLNDPTKWTKLYETNKSVISDKNLIYPYMVLFIPRE